MQPEVVDFESYRAALEDYSRAALTFLMEVPAGRLGEPGFLSSLLEDKSEAIPRNDVASEQHFWQRRRPIFEAELHLLPEYERLRDTIRRVPELEGAVGKEYNNAGATMYRNPSS